MCNDVSSTAKALASLNFSLCSYWTQCADLKPLDQESGYHDIIPKSIFMMIIHDMTSC